MENTFKSFIKNLTDHELSIFIGYQYPGLLSYSKDLIKNEIASRNLSREKINSLMKCRLTYDKVVKYCERCGSNKFIVDSDIEHHRS